MFIKSERTFSNFFSSYRQRLKFNGREEDIKKGNNSHEKPSTIVAKKINYFILKKVFI